MVDVEDGSKRVAARVMVAQVWQTSSAVQPCAQTAAERGQHMCGRTVGGAIGWGIYTIPACTAFELA